MTVAGILLVTAVVWAISLIRSIRWRAFVYSLPLPMTLALVTTGSRVDGAALLGIVGLNVFFLIVTVTHHRFGWHILLADLGGIAGYLALSALVLVAAPVPFLPALTATLAGWLGAMLVLRHGRRAAPIPDATTRPGAPAPVKLLVIFCGAVPTVLLGELLRQMVITFPYSGVLVAIEARRDLPQFVRHFAGNSLGLLAFVAGYHWLQDHSRPVALTAAWTAFAVVALARHAYRPGSGRGVGRRGGGDQSGRRARRAHPPGCS